MIVEVADDERSGRAAVLHYRKQPATQQFSRT